MKSVPAKVWLVLAICVIVWPSVPTSAAETKTEKSSEGKLAETGGTLIRQVHMDNTFREGEAFIVPPGKTLEMCTLLAEGLGKTDVSDPALSAAKGMERAFSSTRLMQFRWRVPFGTVKRFGENLIEWEAPAAPGHYPIHCEVETSGTLRYAMGAGDPKSRKLPSLRTSTTFHFLVPHEFDPEGHGVIESYPIGTYPNENTKDVKAVIAQHREHYRPPRWFVAVTSATRELRVSEHFRLREFIPHAPKDTTVYFPYNANLCRALEAIVADLKTSETTTPHLRILRGFVSPYDAERLRRAGARLLTWNRYQYGDGVLVVANEDAGEKMGDLNRDGKVDVRDAEVLANVVSRVQKRLGLPGWTGIYGERPDTTLPETPMVGFDVRGWWAESYGPESSARE